MLKSTNTQFQAQVKGKKKQRISHKKLQLRRVEIEGQSEFLPREIVNPTILAYY